MKIQDSITNYTYLFSVIIIIFVLFPQIREPILFILNILWQVIKGFFLKDFFIRKVISLGLLVLANILGFCLTSKQKRKILYIIGGGSDIIGLFLIIKL